MRASVLMKYIHDIEIDDDGDDDDDDGDDVVDDLDLERQVGANPTRGRRSPRSAICEMHSDFNDLVSECAVRPALMMMMISYHVIHCISNVLATV